jgi:hypothetical protein
MAQQSPRFPFSSCPGGLFAGKVLVLLTVVAAAGVAETSLRAQDQPKAPAAQPPASSSPKIVVPPGARLLLPRSMLPPQNQVPEAQTSEEEAPSGPNLPTPTLIASPPPQVVSAGSQPTGPRLKVEYALGKLSVTANQVPLSEVLREVCQKTGLEVRGLTEAGKVASIQFSNLPVSQAVQNLLDGSNYALFGELNSPEGVRQARVVILSPTTGADVDVGSGPRAAQ